MTHTRLQIHTNLLSTYLAEAYIDTVVKRDVTDSPVLAGMTLAGQKNEAQDTATIKTEGANKVKICPWNLRDNWMLICAADEGSAERETMAMEYSLRCLSVE